MQVLVTAINLDFEDSNVDYRVKYDEQIEIENDCLGVWKWTQRKMLPMLSQMRLVGALIGSIMKFNSKEILSNALQRSKNNYLFRVG